MAKKVFKLTAKELKALRAGGRAAGPGTCNSQSAGVHASATSAAKTAGGAAPAVAPKKICVEGKDASDLWAQYGDRVRKHPKWGK